MSPSLKMENFSGMYADNMSLIFCPETSLRRLLARLTDYCEKENLTISGSLGIFHHEILCPDSWYFCPAIIV